MLLGLDVVVVFEAVGSKHLLHLLMGTRSNLIDHRPWEGNLRLVFQIVEEGLGNESVADPALSISEDTGLHLVTVVGTVVHRLDGKREPPSCPPLGG